MERFLHIQSGKLFRHFVLGLLLFCAGNVQSQDIHFSQFLLNPLSYNPGLAGMVNSSVRASASYRNQWPGVAPYLTYAGAVDGSFKTKAHAKNRLSAGAHIYKDVAGDVKLSTFHFSGYFGSIFEIDRNSAFSIGINAGIFQRSLEYQNMTWDAQYINGTFDPTNPTFENNNSFFQTKGTVGAGIAYRRNSPASTLSSNDERQLLIGIGAMHMNRPDIAFMSGSDKVPMKITAHADFLYGIENTTFSWRPGIKYSLQGGYREFVFGTYWVILMREPSVRTGFITSARISFGTHVRLNDAFIPSVFLELSDYKLGISYDVNYSDLSPATGGKGGIEFSFIYTSPSSFYYKKNQPGTSPFL